MRNDRVVDKASDALNQFIKKMAKEEPKQEVIAKPKQPPKKEPVV